MEAVAAAQSLSYHPRLPKSPAATCSTTSLSPSFLNCRTSLFLSAKNLRLSNLEYIRIKHCSQRNVGVGVVHASQGGSVTVASPDVAQGWLLEPVGDGDWRHIGYKVAMPGAYEIFSSNKMTVGRAPEKADIVIPVATVSGLHARIQSKGGSLFITDLDSTNGTFINEKRVPPGATALVPPGSLITFGDTNLALFRVSRLEKAQEIEEETEEKAESESIEVAPQPETTS